jgi:hypothetical protein
MQGKEIDMDQFIRKNELTPAVGNMRVNARGDQIGSGGKIVKPRESVIAEYYETNPKAVVQAAPAVEVIVEADPEPVERKTVADKSKKTQAE